MELFHLQNLAQSVLTAAMKQVSEIVALKLGNCPSFNLSQESIGANLNVVMSFTLAPYKDTIGLDKNPDDFIGKFGGPLLDTTLISDASPTLLGNNRGENLFSGLID